MGNCCPPESIDYGYCMISLEKQIYRPKEIINGNVYIKLNKDFPNNKIELAYRGYEEFKFNIKKNYDLKKIKHKVNILDKRFVIKEFNENIIKKGIYQIPFQIYWDKNLNDTYRYQYKDNDKNCYNVICYYMVAFIDNEKDDILLSEKIEVFIENKSLTTYNLNILDYVSFNKYYKKVISIKGDLHTLNKDNFIYSNKEYDYLLYLDGKESKKKINRIKISLISSMEVVAQNYTKKIESIIFEKYFGQLLAKKEENFYFKIRKDLMKSYICTININNLRHNFYFKVELFNESLKTYLTMNFPIIVKIGKTWDQIYDFNFKYYKGKKKIFEENLLYVKEFLSTNKNNEEEEEESTKLIEYNLITLY